MCLLFGVGQVESSDLIAYGLIPEFVGRFPVLVSLSALTENQLMQVKIDFDINIIDVTLLQYSKSLDYRC